MFASAGSYGIFSAFLGDTASAAGTSAPATFNSQTVPVLAAAVNLDPNPAVGGGDITVVDGSALLSQEGPSGTAADIAVRPASAQISVYTVRDGDTLSGIAQMFDVSVNTIIGANNIQHDLIKPGQTLIILPITGIEHTIVTGDTLASLAKKYSSDANDIAQYNDLTPGAALAVGQTILIPGGEVTASTPAPAPTSHSSSSTSKIKKAPGNTEPYLGGSGPILSGYYAWPVDGGLITQGLHGWNAVDIGAPKGTSIYAAAAGTVIVALSNGGWNGGYGNYVVIEHSNGTETLYAHMSHVLTSAGSEVNQGDVIGKVGATGEATGPHLHFEVRGAQNPFASLGVGYSQ
ncbi:MAG: peptidoglycan DD-metalloendopeptidase family protein [Patescibacteria group bacterium]|nr:peptidoglycan DD-metalloendopeptidase family protein [Patescibacteria group bacterium]